MGWSHGSHLGGIDQLLVGGVEPDTLLLSIVYGYAQDQRSGISVLARPLQGDPVALLVDRVQNGLVQLFCRQEGVQKDAAFLGRGIDCNGIWLAPAAWLHMTVLEIVHSSPHDTIVSSIDQILAGDGVRQLEQIQGFEVDSPQLIVDRGGMVISFLPTDNRVINCKQQVHELVTKVLGINVVPRYVVPSCHVTVARFAKALEDLDVQQLISFVTATNEELKSSNFSWRSYTLEYSYGHNWYGNGTKL
jgi:hypothetical protein